MFLRARAASRLNDAVTAHIDQWHGAQTLSSGPCRALRHKRCTASANRHQPRIHSSSPTPDAEAVVMHSVLRRAPSRTRRGHAPRCAVIAVCVGLFAGAATTEPTVSVAYAATAPATDADNAGPNDYGWFEAGLSWRGDFADPHIVRYNGVYYAYSSGAGGRFLGVLTSTDLVNWKAHKRWTANAAPWAGGPDPRTDPAIPAEIRASSQSTGDIYNLNDALVAPAKWGVRVPYNAWYTKDYWATSVTKIGTSWFSFAAVKISNTLGDGTMDPEGFGRYCLTVARATNPLGPFRDSSGSAPIYCDVDPGGSIDPSPYYDNSTGKPWLVWKSAGRRSRPGVQGYPSALKTAQLDANGRIVGPIRTLLTTNEGSWEGFTVENPAMISFQGQWYLFYSANSFTPNRATVSKYATGYAKCAGPAGPCARVSAYPLMSSTPYESGMGGAQSFIDSQGTLRLIYASYTPGEYRTNHSIRQPRRMRIRSVVRRSDGSLVLGPILRTPVASTPTAKPPTPLGATRCVSAAVAGRGGIRMIC